MLTLSPTALLPDGNGVRAALFSGAFGARRVLLWHFVTLYDMVTPFSVATCKTACLWSSKYMCSTNGLRDTDLLFSGRLCLFMDSTGLFVPGRSSQSSMSNSLNTLLNFFKT